MVVLNINPLRFVNACFLHKINWIPMQVHLLPTQSRVVGYASKTLVVEAKFRKRANSRTESAKIQNKRLQKKYNGTPTKPRLSVFIRSDPAMNTGDAAKAMGEELVKAAMNLGIDEISSYDRNVVLVVKG